MNENTKHDNKDNTKYFPKSSKITGVIKGRVKATWPLSILKPVGVVNGFPKAG